MAERTAVDGQNAPSGALHRLAKRVRLELARLEILALFPLIVIGASWYGFDDMALVTAVGLSALVAIGGIGGRAVDFATSTSAATGTGRAGLTGRLQQVSGLAGRDTACILVQLDDWPMLQERWGHDTCEEIAAQLEGRLATALRSDDQLCRLGDARFGIVLSPMSSARLGLRDTIASRLADAIADPLSVRGATLRLTASIGHSALIQHGVDPAETTFKAAEAALGEAMLNGPNTIRAYAPGMGRARALQSSLSEDVEAAIHEGAITAWFQPQIHARTGLLAGMETLARWQHPKHGLLSPREFFSAVEASGHMPLLGQTILHQALKALQDWDAAQANIPQISINFSALELRDTSLPQTLASEVARYGLSPDRIVIEIQESVAAQVDDDAIVATLQALREAGHPVDLEGFGLGAASLPTLQRFGVTRVKIDRSFVLDVDVASTKRQTVTAIIAMAKAMEIKTLANGVETSNEQDALIDLGCDYLQGFGVVRPMGLEAVEGWALARSASGKTIRLDDRRA